MTEPLAKMQTERMKGLTDGVLAIALTLLVLNFEVPDHDFASDRLDAFFRSLIEPFVAYLVSFGIIAAYWIQHAAIYHYVRIANRTFFWLSLLFLLPVTLLPFLTVPDKVPCGDAATGTNLIARPLVIVAAPVLYRLK